MKYDRIEGIDKDISKLVMGCDNQDDINELLQNKCFIRFEYPYKETNNTFLLMQDLKTNYCSQD